MTDAVLGLDPWLKLAGGLVIVAGALVTLWRWAVPRYRNARRVGIAVVDTIVGREPGVDSITGHPTPAVPGIGSRMADQEKYALRMAEEMGILTRAVADLASAQAEMSAIQSRIDDHDRRISDHDRRLTLIEQAPFYERMAGKAESVAMFRAMEAIAKDDPPDDAA